MSSSQTSSTAISTGTNRIDMRSLATQLSRLSIPQASTNTHASSSEPTTPIEAPIDITVPPNTPTLEESQLAMEPTDSHITEGDLSGLDDLLPLLDFEVSLGTSMTLLISRSRPASVVSTPRSFNATLRSMRILD